MQRGDAFLLPTPTGYAFGAVLSVDYHRERAVVRFQAGDYATASLPVIQQWKETLVRVGTEVKTA